MLQKSPPPPPRMRIGLLWHSVNSENLGVTALTASNVAIVEGIAAEMGLAVEFVVFGWNDPGPAQVSRPNLEVFAMKGRDLVDPRGLYAQMRRCHLVLDISTGDGFSDIYGPKRFLFGVLSRLAIRAAGKPHVFAPQTIGPFTRGWVRLAARAMMNTAAAVVTRDTLSADYARSLGVRSVLESTDVAFRLPFDPPPPRPPGKVRVGLNISGLLFNGGYTRDNMFELKADYPALARSLIGTFVTMSDCELHLIAHVISEQFEVEDDYRTALKLREEFPGVVVAPRFATPSEAKSYIATLDFFAGSRMHACIAAYSSGVPVVPIAYSRKFAGLFNTLGYREVADCKTETAADIHAKVLAGFARRAELRAKVESGRKSADDRLAVYTNVIRRQFADFMKRQLQAS
jgi:polysaccharide pyruvyl transferase WcaK-like protein